MRNERTTPPINIAKRIKFIDNIKLRYRQKILSIYDIEKMHIISLRNSSSMLRFILMICLKVVSPIMLAVFINKMFILILMFYVHVFFVAIEELNPGNIVEK